MPGAFAQLTLRGMKKILRCAQDDKRRAYDDMSWHPLQRPMSLCLLSPVS